MKKLALITLVFLVLLTPVSKAQTGKSKVMVMEIKDEIDPRMLRYVKLALENAEKIKADYVVIDMDTYGGVLTDAKEIVDLIMDFKKPVWVYVNSDAASAGALISIACDSIYMSPGATIGAATVVEGAGGQAAPDKYQAYMRGIMRSTAEKNGRDPRIAEGMVDERIVIDSIKQEGRVITFTTKEALKYGFCEAQVETIQEILKRNKVTNYELEIFKLGTTEKIIAFVINPFISGILILIILGGIYFELQTPGIGFPLFASVTALILYLVPYYLNGLAEYWEIIALFVGILLLMAEVFVIPGFGVAGIAGIILTVMSLVLIMLNNDFFNFEFVPMGDIIRATFAAIGGISGGMLLLFFGGARLTETKAFQRMALTDQQESSQGFSVNTSTIDMLGKKGISHTVLRPSGKVFIDEIVYDAFTRGEYVEKGESIEVVGIEGVTLRVKKSIG
ncbi:MAG: nodulation protein NfeD [Cytophagales bacterium]|jgi:membrane-bound serine protease (ClpP class)|nr:nodulation protein NfeD [Cytophagales bacterium]MCA6387990.1 nodulation protein NfeD [Cytophagales bacterium]MCA6393004.1 nodulation protein NfeD [Cytophagales bacterium]MCA6395327.1 nodulation protein NfeD [Cytophagales bacterium]MCA6397581.1 nodulation protein NfeD [Cytophagales bacterium]